MTQPTSTPAPTSGGREVTQETIERLAAEAEAGYDLTRLRRVVGRPAMGSAPARVVPVRLGRVLRIFTGSASMTGCQAGVS